MLRWPRLPCVILLSLYVVSGLSWAGPEHTEYLPPQSIPSTSSRAALPDSTLLGVVWTPPESEKAALQALQQMDDMGVTAVRLTRLPSGDAVFTRADSLGLRLFVDLPVAYVSATRLRDSLDQAGIALKRILALARRHGSVQYVGLARHVDTTAPFTCSILEEWSNRIHAQSETSLSTYYVTPFQASRDRCADAVDLPLLDVRGHESPLARLQQWKKKRPPVGLGALGTWTRPDANSGLRVAHSPEWQARYLERALSTLLDSTRAPPPAVFVYRWQDQASPLLASRRYGLHDLDGTPRPAASVVQGQFTGMKQVFAFPSGPTPSSGPHALLLLGWGLIAVLGGLYARSSFVRDNLVRYFTAHGFYRDALRRGRKVAGGIHVTLLVLVALAVGIVAALATRGVASLPAAEYVLAALPPTLQSLITTGLDTPITTGLLFGGVVLILLFLWTFILTVVARRQTRFSFSQGLMLVAWPCWSAFPLMILSLVTATHPPVSPMLLGKVLLLFGILATLGFTIRVLVDYHAVTELPLPTVVLLGGLSPFLLSTGTITYLLWHYEVALSLAWHLATQT